MNSNIYNLSLSINLSSVIIDKNNKVTRNRLQTNRKLLEYLDMQYSPGYKDSHISFQLLLNIIEFLLSATNKTSLYQNLATMLHDLRGVESEVRNVTAHQIEFIDSDYIKKNTGISPNEVLKKIKSIIKTVYGNQISGDFINKYDDMNKILIGFM